MNGCKLLLFVVSNHIYWKYVYYLIAFNKCCKFATVLLWRLIKIDLTASKLIISLKKKWTKNNALNWAEQRVARNNLVSEDTAGEYRDDILVLDNIHQSIIRTSWRVTLTQTHTELLSLLLQSCSSSDFLSFDPFLLLWHLYQTRSFAESMVVL